MCFKANDYHIERAVNIFRYGGISGKRISTEELRRRKRCMECLPEFLTYRDKEVLKAIEIELKAR